MPQASLQLNQLLGDGALLNALKKGGLKKAIGEKLGAETVEADQIAVFQNLLAGIAKAKHGDNVSKILSASSTQGSTKKTDAVDATSLWGQLQITPELVAALKNLSPDDLKDLPPEVADFLAPYLNSDGALSDKIIGILDALSAPVNDDGETPELFTVVDDPDLAAFLVGFAAHLNQAAVEQASDALVINPTTIQPFASFLRTQLSAPVIIDTEKGTLSTEVEVLPGQKQTLTLSIADLDSDGFQALKKLAFADIAPYLTLPRTVQTSGNTVVKIAQGPSFLSEDNSDSALLASAVLAPSLPAELVAKLNANTPAMSIASAIATSQAPVFMNTDTKTQTVAAMQTSKVPHAFGKTQLLAALMGVPEQETPTQGAQQAATTPGAGNTDTKTGEATPLNAPEAAMAQGFNAGAKTANTVAVATSTPTAQAATATAATANPAAQMKGLDHSLISFENNMSYLMDDGLETALHVKAGQSSPGSSVTTLMTARAAGQPHPSTHLVSVVLQQAAQNAGTGLEKQFVIRMDPPELGRIKVTLEFTENNTVKAKLLAERPETLSLLQKDAVMLQRALADSGVDTAHSELSFDLGQDSAFSGGGGHDGSGGDDGSQQNADDGTPLADIETVMSVFVDPQTGMTHVNIVI